MTSKDQGLAGDLAARDCACIGWVRMYGAGLPGEYHHRDCTHWHRQFLGAEVFVTRSELIVTGTPDEGDEGHNCDAMGCTSVSHVLFRRALATPVATPEPDLPSWLMKEWDGGDEEEYWRISAELERNRLATTATGEPPKGAWSDPEHRTRFKAWVDGESVATGEPTANDCLDLKRTTEAWHAAIGLANDRQKVIVSLRAKLDALTGEPTDATENAKLREALRDLLNDTQHKEHIDCEDGPCPVREARELLAASKEQQ